MMNYRYIVNDIPPSNNKFIGRNARWQYGDAKKHWCSLIIYNVIRIGAPDKPIERARVHLHYRFKNKRRRDPDNYSGKMILDGLTNAKVIKDDCFTCIDLSLSAEFGCETEQTIIDIEELIE